MHMGETGCSAAVPRVQPGSSPCSLLQTGRRWRNVGFRLAGRGLEQESPQKPCLCSSVFLSPQHI